MRNNIFIIILFGFSTKCFNDKSEKYKYPDNLSLIEEKKRFNFTQWKIYEYLGNEQSEVYKFEGYKSLKIRDTLCLSLNLKGNYSNDNGIEQYSFFIEKKDSEFCECKGTLHLLPNTFAFQKDSIWLILGDNMLVDYNTFYKNINWEEKERQFPDIIRKHKDQLNPWLKGEAQRRGIIE